MKRSAVISPCGRYRYELWRDWRGEQEAQLGLGPLELEGWRLAHAQQFALFVLLNPSTADAEHDDPTTRKCVSYARRWGYGAACLANAFAFRATDPSELYEVADPVGPENDGHLEALGAAAGIVVAGWGRPGRLQRRDERVLALLPRPVHCLAQNTDGTPAHPLYLPGGAEPVPLPLHPDRRHADRNGDGTEPADTV